MGWVRRRAFWNPARRRIWKWLGGNSGGGLAGGAGSGRGAAMEEESGGSKGAPELSRVWNRQSGAAHRWAGSASSREPHAPVCPLLYPRRKHVAALLDMRGLRRTAARHEILAVARDLELSEGGSLSRPRDRAFFADIPVPRPPFCLSLPLFLGRLPLSRLACLPWPRPPSPSRARAQR